MPDGLGGEERQPDLIALPTHIGRLHQRVLKHARVQRAQGIPPTPTDIDENGRRWPGLANPPTDATKEHS